MIKDEKINEMVFVEQRTYYIYRSEEDRTNGIPFMCSSQEETFLKYKEAARKGEWKLKKEKP